ncbi:MAG TPA: DsbA family protein [Longimicrobiaceae bacterium]|nr:DsbA family protein [Longimicrobiaceae bacterium]
MARPPSKSKGSSLNTFYGILGVIAVIGAGAILYQMYGQGSAAMQPVDVPIDQAQLAATEGISIGEEDAPVVIFEFADFQCPACGTYATFVTPLIKERMVEPGLVRYVFYDFPLEMHPNSFIAARAGRCANDQDMFWAYHDILFAQQSSWSLERDPIGMFVDMADEVGLDAGQFESCLRSDMFAEEVTRSLRLGESLGVRGTPTLFVNGRRLPSPPTFNELEVIVQNAAGLSQAPADTAAAPADTAAAS